MEERNRRAPWWLIAQLWGLDVLAAAFLWGLSIAAFAQVVVIDEGPLILLGVAAWMTALVRRLSAAASGKGWYVRYYRSHIALLMVVTLCVTLAALWMLFFYVGQSMIGDLGRVAFPMLLVVLLPILSRIGLSKSAIALMRDLIIGIVYASACIVPTEYMCMGTIRISTAPVWYFSILIGLFFMMRRGWRDGGLEGSVSVIITLGLLLLMLAALATSISAPFYERSFCVMVAMGCACLQMLMRLRGTISTDAFFSIGWAVMALPPLLGIVMFTPECW